MSRLNHISTYRDVKRGKAVYINSYQRVWAASRILYRVEKNGREMSYIFALGKHVFDIRDLANVYAPEYVGRVNAFFDMRLSDVREVLEKAAPHLVFPRKAA